MKRNSSYLAGAFVVFLVALYFFAQEKIPAVLTTQKSSAPLRPKASVPLAEEKPLRQPEQKKTEPSCEAKVMRKIAGNCNRACLYQYVRKKDSELSTMMEELEKPTEDALTKIGKFYYAQESGVDLETQRKLLHDLASTDRENAYPSFFLANLYIFSDPEKARVIVGEGLTRKSYESYTTQFIRRLKRATIDRPEVYAEAFVFSVSLPIYNLNTSVLWPFEELDSELAKKMALKIIKPTLDNKGEYGDLLWGREDYVMARYMLSKADPTENSLYPEYDVESFIFERAYPGMSQKCDEQGFFSEREREKLRLQNLQGIL